MLTKITRSTFALFKSRVRVTNKEKQVHLPFMNDNKQKEVKQLQFLGKNSKQTETQQSNVKSKKPMANKVEDEDIHSIRMNQAISLTLLNEENSSYKFKYRTQEQMKQLKLDDLNIVNIESEDKMDIIPQLNPHLDFITKSPAIYPVEEVKKLLDNSLIQIFILLISQISIKNFWKQFILKKSQSWIDLTSTFLLQKIQLYQKQLKRQIQNICNHFDIQSDSMSTSTFSSLLQQLFYIVSGFKGPYFNDVFDKYQDEPKKFMITQRKPISNFLHLIDKQKGIYAIDSDPGIFTPPNYVLMNIGKIVERQLTLSREEFIQRFVDDVPPPHLKPLEDYHRFMSLNNEICLRSQIDCYSFKDGKPFVFEIKSRSACPYRYDFPNYFDYYGYEVKQLEGLHSSYEREFYDLIRGAFLKWSFQLRIGNMDGAFVAYHNIQKVQGFEFITTKEINKRIFGTEQYAETLFSVTSRLGTTLIEEIISALKEEEYESIKFGVYASSYQRKLIIFTELYKSKEEVDNLKPIAQTKEIFDEYDYYTKYKPLQNKVIKFELNIKIFVNGIEQICGCRAFREGDLLNIQYQLKRLNEVEFKDYMNFLHDCYKHEEINLDLTYSGAWLKVQ